MPTVMTARWSRLALGVALAWPLAAAAAPAPPGKAAAPASPAEKLRKELDRVLSIDLDQQPLHLAINQLHEQTKVNFVLDRFTLGQVNVDPDTPVSLRLKDVPLRSTLRTLLTPFNLGFAIVGDTVLISSEDMVTVRQLRQRVNVDLDKVEFARALRQLARETATNLVVDTRVAKEAQQPVTLQVEDTPLETAVRLMAEMAGLKPVRVGNALFVTTKSNAAEMRADPDLAPVPQPANPGAQPGMVDGVVAPAAVPPAPPPAVKPAQTEETEKTAPKKGKVEEEEKPARPADKGDKPPEKPAKPEKP
jgi:hypothetical protein